MKNNKIAQAVMLVFVLGVWAVIFYKIYDKLKGEDTPLVAYDTPGIPMNMHQAADTFQLLANYNDPFLYKSFQVSEGHSTAQQTSANATLRTEKKTTAPLVAVQPQVIKYLGMIKNNASKKKVALVSINGKSSLMQENESFENVKLLKLFKDSVLVLCGKQKLYLRNSN